MRTVRRIPGRDATARGVEFAREPVVPLANGARLADFYGYRSASAHTGFERVGLANIILHLSRLDQGLGVVFVGGIDGDDGGPLQPDSRMEATQLCDRVER